jgi:hypothetical protein
MKRMVRWVLAVAGLSLTNGPENALAQNRLALVIGINEYQNIFSLEKAVGDAKAIQQNGQKTIESGRYVQTGAQVPWMYRCGD